jgi:tRNA(Ile)-lysidine synthase
VALIGDESANTARFGIAVSGGPDSMALLLLAHGAWPGRVEAATVDHQLRSGSADEAAHVARVCAAHSIPHRILTPDSPITGSIQTAARAARYALLARWRAAAAIDWVMTAHHADDQFETLIMRLNSRSGLAGLCGIRARQGHVLRPFLRLRRDTLADWIAQQGVPVVDDPSNRNHDFDRARLRAALVGQTWFDPEAAADSMAFLAEAEAALEWTTEQLVAQRVRVDGEGRVILDSKGLPPELLRRLMIAALDQVQPGYQPRGAALQGAIRALGAGEQAMLGDVLLSPVADGHWALRTAPPRRRGR